jgi:hypothetical protein
MRITYRDTLGPDMQAWRKSLDSLSTFDVRHLLLPSNYKAESGLCTSLTSLSLEYPRYQYWLMDEVTARRLNDSHYN